MPVSRRQVAPSGSAPSAHWMLALVAMAELLGMSLWFTASALAPRLQLEWALSAQQTAALTSAVQFGFVAGTLLAAVLNLADLIPARWYFSVSGLLAAAANAGLAADPGFEGALVLRFATGFFLAGVYPPAMKMVATWFVSARGLAIGTVVGALTVGKATPYLLRAVPGAGVAEVVLAASVAAVVASLLVATLFRDGPHRFPRRAFSWRLVMDVFGDRPTRLAIGGYLGHMWELYAMWTWAPAFVAASWVAHAGADPGAAPGAADWRVDAISFVAIAAGGLGCVWGGLEADRRGRERLVILALVASGACCLLSPFVFGLSPWLLVALVLVWGFFVVADSAQFSALVTEVAPPHAVGTALTLQTSVGFLLTSITIQGVPELADAWGWRWAFPLLVLGPIAGIEASRRLMRRRPDQ